MAIGDAAHREITDMEDSRVFFEIATGHSVPNWGYVDQRAKVYGGKCEHCERNVRSDVDQSAVENECDRRRVDMVHDS